MANQQTECLNDKCEKKVADGNIWCSLECKKQFLLAHYSDGQCNLWFKEADRDFRERQKKVMAEVKESGLTFTEFLKSLGDFKEDVVQ